MRLIIASLALLALVACGGITRNPVPLADHNKAQIHNIENARYWGDRTPENFSEIVSEIRRQRQASGLSQDVALALSGGADLGAFGAGIINAWTTRGDRPEFTLVTGISTGALSAPFAFLGPDYDHALQEIYGGYPADEIIRTRFPWEILPKASAVDTTPLQNLIAKYVDELFLEKIAAEHRRGRRLLVQSTHMDAQRPMIWNMGAIANSGAPNALDLFRQVLLASASIPVAFPPVLIDVDVDGEIYDEMHVDGGIISQLTMLSSWQSDISLALEKTDETTTLTKAYIIVNGKVAPEPEIIDFRLLPIGRKSILTMIKGQTVFDLHLAYQGLQTRNASYYATWIGADFTKPYVGPFDPAYMKALFDYGYDRMLSSDPWSQTPPSVI